MAACRTSGPQIAKRSSFIKPGDEVVPGIRAVDAAGHSIGMMAYHIESNPTVPLSSSPPA